MRIGINATILENSQPTGLGFFTINLINSLSKLHDRMLVWTINDAFLNRNVEKRLVLTKYRDSKYCYLIRFLWDQTILPILIKRENIDIFLSPIPQGIIKCPVKQVVVVHDLLPLIWPHDFPFYTKISFKYFIPKVIRKSDLILSVSEQTKKDIIHFYATNKDKIKVIWECINMDFFAKSLDTKKTYEILNKYKLKYKKYILFVSALTYRKNLHTLIKAYKNILPEFSDLKLVIVGKALDKEYVNYINKVIMNHDLYSSICFLGYIPYDELPYIYKGAKVFVYPPLYEGFGLPILEAFCCGTPVISSDRVPSAQMIKEVMTFSPEDQGELTALLRRILKSLFFISDDEIKKLRDKFSCQHIGDRIIQEISALYE